VGHARAPPEPLGGTAEPLEPVDGLVHAATTATTATIARSAVRPMRGVMRESLAEVRG
jgi:hypothetical protein